jgi:23S rRNA (pseudouridine1915-N3)-methyltransferase
MALRLVAVGRVKQEAIRTACEEYAARIARYDALTIDEVKEARRPEREAAQARTQEGERLLKVLEGSPVVVALTRTGRAVSSAGLADRLREWRESARAATFVLGGTFGLSEEVLRRADWQMRLSDLTLPHDVARLVLLEQLYRAHTILRGEPYHKGSQR